MKRHLLSAGDLTRADAELVLTTAEEMRSLADRPIKKLPALRGRTVVNLFFEDSTRTRISFEAAAKRLSADVINFSAKGSSLSKGESLKDTALTLEAMGADAAAGLPWMVTASTSSIPAMVTRTRSTSEVGRFLPTKSARIGSSRWPRSTSTASWTALGRPISVTASRAARIVRPENSTSSTRTTTLSSIPPGGISVWSSARAGLRRRSSRYMVTSSEPTGTS